MFQLSREIARRGQSSHILRPDNACNDPLERRRYAGISTPITELELYEAMLERHPDRANPGTVSRTAPTTF